MRQRRATRFDSVSKPAHDLGAVPLIGRDELVKRVDDALAARGRVLLHGAPGAGKTAVAEELVRAHRAAGRSALLVRVLAGDTVDAVRGRVRRALAARDHVRTRVVIDELRGLAPTVVAAALRELTSTGHELLLVADTPSAGDDVLAIEVGGLGATDARILWTTLEERFGPTKQGRCDAAITSTQGLPRALRRAYADAAFASNGKGALEKRVLAAADVLGVPAPTTALAAMLGDVDAPAVATAVGSLLARQLVELHADGAVALAPHARAPITAATRRELHTSAATVWADRRGPLGDVEPAAARRAELEHQLAGSDDAAAVRTRLEASLGLFVANGAAAEAEAVLRTLPAPTTAKGKPAPAAEARLYAALGRVADAIASASVASVARGSGSHAMLPAELLLRAGDPRAARAVLGGGDGTGSSLAIELVLHEQGPEAAAADRSLEALGAFGALLALELGDVAHAHRLALAAATRGASDETAEALIVQARAALAEGRPEDAAQVLAAAREAIQSAKGDTTPTASTLAGAHALATAELALARGELRAAESTARALVADARSGGDELTALAGDELLARALAARGRVAEARRVADAAEASASGRGLGWLAARTALARAEADATVGAGAAALGRARKLATDVRLGLPGRARALAAAARLAASLGEVGPDAGPALMALAALAHGDAAEAARQGRAALGMAIERGDRAGVAIAAATVARLAVARGDRQLAETHAERALADGAAVGEDRAVAGALLVQASLARALGPETLVDARLADATAIARTAGLHVELAVALAACATITSDDADARKARRLAAEAALTDGESHLVQRWLTELGFGSSQGATLVAADGAACSVADLDAVEAELGSRSLVVDGVRERVVKNGKLVADLRKRTLLKRLLYVFAGSPRTSFTKEELVRLVWRVDYHPLRHDAALFTNVMRLRRLLGPEGAQLLLAGEQGYSWNPPNDALFLRGK